MSTICWPFMSCCCMHACCVHDAVCKMLSGLLRQELLKLCADCCNERAIYSALPNVNYSLFELPV